MYNRLLFILKIVLIGGFLFSQEVAVTKIADGFMFTEGPVMLPSGILLFSDIPANTVYQWAPESGNSVYLTPSGNSNGLILDKEDRLLLAQHGPRQISRLETDQSLIPLATHYQGKRLNSPNDLVLHSDGSIFFTDPPYGLNDQGGTSELGYNGIYRLAEQGEVVLLDNSLNRPNGIGLSPDESILYVSDSENRNIYAWDLKEDLTVENKRLLAHMDPFGYADGMTVGRDGRLFVAGPIGVWIFEADGTLISTIEVPGQTSNCCWGNTEQSILFATSGNAVYQIELNDLASEVGRGTTHPLSPVLLGNFPNPFNYSTKICFRLEQAERVRLSIFNLAGESVETLVNEPLSPGFYQIFWDTNALPSATYIYTLSTEYRAETGRCVSIK